MELIFAPIAMLMTQPWIAGLIGVGFVALFLRRRQRPAARAAVLWIVYCLYEFGMKWRVLCTGECNIRTDLLIIWPILLLTSGAALWSAFRHRPDPQ